LPNNSLELTAVPLSSKAATQLQRYVDTNAARVTLTLLSFS
jgi:hypothetical protein